jgi:hypothetical protein
MVLKEEDMSQLDRTEEHERYELQLESGLMPVRPYMWCIAARITSTRAPGSSTNNKQLMQVSPGDGGKRFTPTLLFLCPVPSLCREGLDTLGIVKPSARGLHCSKSLLLCQLDRVRSTTSQRLRYLSRRLPFFKLL